MDMLVATVKYHVMTAQHATDRESAQILVAASVLRDLLVIAVSISVTETPHAMEMENAPHMLIVCATHVIMVQIAPSRLNTILVVIHYYHISYSCIF